MAVVISSIEKNSPAEKAGILQGESLVSINGNAIKDVLDYRFYMTDRNLDIELLKDGKTRTVSVSKPEYEDLGLDFETYLMDKEHCCKNKCIFCFIDQMPPNMRETLYFKDDDSRLGFLFGNYVTLTNLEEEDIDRIIKMRLSPINVSVHTMNPKLRVEMMKNPHAADSLDYLKKMADAGITLHLQFVLCPGINDGSELDRTLSDLLTLGHIRSVSIVPIGKTKHRDGLCEIPSVDKEKATLVLEQVEAWQKKALEKTGSRLFFASDEFYLKAEREIPSADEYEQFPQIENGVGLIASMKEEFFMALKENYTLTQPRRVSVATGASAFNFIKSIAKEAENRYNNLKVDVYEITNNFFGEEITVAGLLCGCDILSQLKGKPLGDCLLISKCMLRDSSNVLLDDITVDDIQQELGVKVLAVENDGYEFLEALLGI